MLPNKPSLPSNKPVASNAKGFEPFGGMGQKPLQKTGLPKPAGSIDLGGSKPKSGGSSFDSLFGGKERTSLFDFKKKIRKIGLQERYKFAPRALKFGDEDKKNMEDFVINNKKYSADGVISKSDLEAILKREIDPALKNVDGIKDPKTGKFLDPKKYADRLRIQDLRETVKNIKEMIKKK